MWKGAAPQNFTKFQKKSAFHIKFGNTGRLSLIFEFYVTDNYKKVSTTFEPVYGIL